MSVADRVEVLVPARPRLRPGVGGRRHVAHAVAVIATGAAVLLSLQRTPFFGATDTIWAEDGRQFYQGTFQHDFFDLLFTPYNGYLHFVPRVLIEITRIFPLAWAAAVIAALGALVTSSCALLIYRASSRHLRSPALRVAVAAPIVLPYVAQEELANNLCCLHFLLLYVAFWMVIWNPASRGLQVLAAFVLFATTGSDPVAGVYLPLALLRCRAVRGWRGLFPAVAIGAGLVFQAVGIVFRNALHSRGISPHYDPIWATKQFFETVIGQGFYTEDLNYRFHLVPSGDAHYLAWALAAGLVALALLRVTQPNWPVVVVALVHSWLLFAGLAMQGGSDAPRYELPAICLFLVAVGGMLVPRGSSAGSLAGARGAEWAWLALRSTPAFVALGLVTLCIFGGYAQGTNWRGNGPSFSSELDKAGAACRDGSARSAVITVAPSFAEWTLTVPCDAVRDRDAFFQLSP